MILAKLTIVVLFIFAWLRAKPSPSAEVSDIFILSFVTIYLPGFLFNSDGETQRNALTFSDSTVNTAEFGFMLALAVGAAVFVIRYYTEQRFPGIRRSRVLTPTPPTSVNLAWIAASISMIAFGAFLLSPEFRDFKFNVFKFFTLNLQGAEYIVIRNTGYSNSEIVEGILGRARFAMFPILYCMIVYPLLKRRLILVLMLISALFFFALPASLSKLPVIFFAGYLAILLATRFPALLDIGWLAIMALVGAALSITMLVLLYVAQYNVAVMNGTLQPFNLAIERLWGEPYSVLVRYFAVYPDIMPYTGWSGINLMARLSGLPTRMPDIEVARAVLGPNSGSNPGVFFLGGYAAFGMTGLALFSFLGFSGMWLLDVIGRKIRLTPLRAIYLAVIGMNILFLNQIALQTALITYGLGVMPIIILVIDRLLIRLNAEKIALQ